MHGDGPAEAWGITLVQMAEHMHKNLQSHSQERNGQGGAFLPWAVLTQHNNASDVELA